MRKTILAIAATVALVEIVPARAQMPIPMREPVITGSSPLSVCMGNAGAKLQQVEVAVSAAASAARLDTYYAQQSLSDDEWQDYLKRAKAAANKRKTALTNAGTTYRRAIATCNRRYGTSN
jgi:hypothetical protein